MLGKRIDCAALTLAGIVGFYLFFMGRGLGVPTSCGLTLVCAALLHYLVRNRPRSHRTTKAQAEAALLSITLMEPREAEAALRALTGREDALILIRHPEDALTLSELFEIWRERGDGACVVATCGAQQGAARFAKARGIELMDKSVLLKRLHRTGMFAAREAKAEPLLPRLERAWNQLRVRPRMAVYGLGLIWGYLATGRVLNLICGLGVLGIMGVKLIDRYA